MKIHDYKPYAYAYAIVHFSSKYMKIRENTYMHTLRPGAWELSIVSVPDRMSPYVTVPDPTRPDSIDFWPVACGLWPVACGIMYIYR